MARGFHFFARIVLSALFVFVFSAVSAQQTPNPDYGIRNIRSRLENDGTTITVEFEVQNTGATATIPATVDLIIIQSGETIAQDTIPPLQATEIVTVHLPIAVNQLPPGSVQSLRAAVGIDEVEASGSNTIRNNFAQISIEVPGIPNTTQPETTQPETPQPTAPPSPSTGFPQNLIDSLPFEIDTTDPTQRAVIAGVGGGVIILILLAIIILRLIFRRTPTFGVWQPPYADMPYVDPNSVSGRRHLWQRTARNNALPANCAENNPHIRKLLQGIDGQHLNGWRIAAVRMSSYDRYGRIAPSQVIASPKIVKRLNKVAHKYQHDDYEKLTKRVRPIAKGLMKAFKKKINKRYAMLPIALDIRFEGEHGEVRIVFELYQCVHRQWQQIDHWEPEMTVVGKLIHEIYEYSLYGQRPGESNKAYRKRLQEDLTGILVYMISAQSNSSLTQNTLTHPVATINEADVAPAPSSIAETNSPSGPPSTTHTSFAPDTIPIETQANRSPEVEATSETKSADDDA
ncbi:MAG: hypothetical protein D6737_04055 [Chloroflexi bacterium]|nr:MAG: hypothetical protein D6737_04055 [Chloroflexota bacterium]